MYSAQVPLKEILSSKIEKKGWELTICFWFWLCLKLCLAKP